ncbi:MAG: OsmC family protein [Actinomycetota bacterium]
MSVRYESGDHFSLEIGRHRLDVDQPVRDGGADVGPTPTELFVAGLATCVAFYAGRFFRRHQIEAKGFEVVCDYTMSTDRRARVTCIHLDLLLPKGFPAERREAFQRVVEHCTVHNSLRQPPDVELTLIAAQEAA